MTHDKATGPMSQGDWRAEFDPHRLRLFDETARFLADGQARATGDKMLRWEHIAPQHQENLTHTVAAVWVAQARAFAKIEAEIMAAND